MKKAGYLPAFFSFFAARFSFSDFSGFFFSVFFWSMPFMTRSDRVDGVELDASLPRLARLKHASGRPPG
jgi:hypothetical protein